MLHRQRIERQEIDIRVVDDVAGVRGFLGRASDSLEFPTCFICSVVIRGDRGGKRRERTHLACGESCACRANPLWS